MSNFKKLFRCIKNWFFCKKYPFWKITDDWYRYNTSINDSRIGKKDFFTLYNYTWYDDIPRGWQKAFGKKLSNELLQTGKTFLKAHKNKKWSDILQFIQIKEKYGSLRLYANVIDELSDILDKYECLSICYCIVCGKPARYKTRGYISFLCENCFNKYEKDSDVEYKHIYRLKEEDIPGAIKFEEESIPNSTETFRTKKEAEKRFNELMMIHENDDIFYTIEKIKDHKWTVTGFKYVEHKVDFENTYNIDYYKLWDL